MGSIVITGASGQLGRAVAELLLDAGTQDLVLVTRTPSALEHLAARGAEVRAGDFDEPDSLQAAFAGAERLLLISTDRIGARVAAHRAAIEAAAAAGVRHVVYTSVPNPSNSNPIAVVPDHRDTEDALRASGLAWTFLRNATYADLLVGPAQAALASGRHVANDGDGRTAYVTRHDCAAVAVAVLTGTGHERRAYDVTGGEALSPADVAGLVSELGGKAVAPALVDDAAFRAAMVEHAGLPEPMAAVVESFGRGARLGYLGQVSGTVQDLTGRAPQTVRDVLAAAL